jgi:hypothetical protein
MAKAKDTKMTKLLTVKNSKMERMMTTKDNEMKRMIIAKENKINKLNNIMITLKESVTKDNKMKRRIMAKDNEINTLNNTVITLKDEMKRRIMAKDNGVNKLNNVIIRFKESVTPLKESERGLKEDMECMGFDHQMEQRDKRRTLKNVVCTKQSVIKEMHKVIIDQREMTYEMLDEVIDTKKAGLVHRKSQQCHQHFNITFEED